MTKESQSAKWSPFAENVQKRAYTEHNIDPDQVAGKIDEPVFEAPNLDAYEDTFNNVQQNPSPSSSPSPAQESPLSAKDQKAGIDNACEVAIDGYAMVKSGIGRFAGFNKNKLEREFAEGTINPNLKIPVSETQQIGIMDYAEAFNQELKENFTVSEEFKENVRPPLKRVLAKRGLVMTDELLLAYYFGKDIAESAFTAFELNKSVNSLTKQLRLQTEAMFENQKPPTPPSQPAPSSSPTPSPSGGDDTGAMPEREFAESEEMNNIEDVDILMDNISDHAEENFEHPEPNQDGMPVMGDKELIDHMEKTAEQHEEKPKKRKPRKR